MVFITVSPKEAAQYAYICQRLKDAVNKMCTARKTIEAAANASFDKPFAKCMYMLASESLQCENEMRAHIDSMICNDNEDEHHTENRTLMPSLKVNTGEGIYNFFKNAYLALYKDLLNDRYFSASSLKDLIQNHIRQFNWSLTQLKLFNDVNAMPDLN